MKEESIIKLKKKRKHSNELEYGTIINDFKILYKLGDGAFGITYKAQDLILHRTVAIKEYLPQHLAIRDNSTKSISIIGNEKNKKDYNLGLKKFYSEAQILATLIHPNIVRIHKFFIYNQTAYFVMSYIEGETLSNYSKNSKNLLNENFFVQFITSLLEGLKKAHKEDIIHRDIKPDNILVTKEGIPILIDFGASRIEFSIQKSLTINAILTPPYPPYEQYGTANQGGWTDIYALGIIMYKIISGLPSSEIPSSINRANALLSNNEDPLLIIRNPLFSEKIHKIIYKAISIKSKERFQNANEMIEALNNNSRIIEPINNKNISSDIDNLREKVEKKDNKILFVLITFIVLSIFILKIIIN